MEDEIVREAGLGINWYREFSVDSHENSELTISVVFDESLILSVTKFQNLPSISSVTTFSKLSFSNLWEIWMNFGQFSNLPLKF